MFDNNYPRLKIGVSKGLVHGVIDQLSNYCDIEFAPANYSDICGYIFEGHLRKQDAILPTEDIARLENSEIRESFLTRVYRYHDWKRIKQEGITAGALVNFQSEQKYLIMAYDQQRAKTLGRMIAGSGKSPDLVELSETFIELTMAVLSHSPKRCHHTNALHHIMGYLSKQIDTNAKQELLDCIESFEKEEVSLLEPINLLKDYFRKYPNPYISKQRYLSPFPDALRVV